MSIWGSADVYSDQMVAANAVPAERVAFIKRTYAHLAGAVLAFVGLEAFYFNTPIAQSIASFALGMPFGYLLIFGGFLLVGWVAERMAQSGAAASTQYAGLALFTIAESIIFVPILYIAVFHSSEHVLPGAAITTLCVFAGLTGVVFFTGKDFSFLRSALTIGSFLGLGLIVCAILFGISLGVWFAVGMSVLMSGFILFYTSKVLHHYPTNQHVAASLALFSSVATLFWYILQIFMSRD